MRISREAYEKARKFLGDPLGYTEGKAIDPLFTMGLPVESVPEDRREEYSKLLAIWKVQLQAQKDWPLRYVSGSASNPWGCGQFFQN